MLIPKRQGWQDLRVRVVSALVLAPVGLAGLWLGGLAWDALIILLALGMAMEWSAMSRANRVSIRKRFPGVLLSGLCYIGPATLALIWLRDDALVGRANVLFVVLVVWASDIGAYLLGRLIGGPKLAPRLSPGKTWSGAAGGFCSAVAVGLIAAEFEPAGSALPGAVVAASLGIASQLGDLLESALKRHFGVKDSGRLIPGHGGLLDRLDGMLMAAPVAAILILALGRGVVLWQ